MTFRTLIDPPALAALLERGEVALFDCRFDLADPAAGRRAYADGHIAGAHYLHLDEDLSGHPTDTNGRHPLPDRDAFAALMASLGVGGERQAVACDASGGIYAARLWWMLRWIGHGDAAVLDGGLPAWTAAGLPLVRDELTATARDGGVRGMIAEPVDADAVEAAIGTPGMLVVDARSPARFGGAPDPLDPVPGHIPGARNRFFRDNLTPDGRFKDAATLAAEWRAATGGFAPEAVVHQCGSGVTAAHNLLAMEVAGLSGSRLYPGSWSEWAAQPGRPIARGDGG